MISVAEAKRLMLAGLSTTPIVEVPFSLAIQRYLAHDVIAPFDHPLFDTSAVDGYAFSHADEIGSWDVVTEIPAGKAYGTALRPGECARIFTGAMMPAGADTVVMQEYVTRDVDRIAHSDVRLKRGGNVRLKGEQLTIGDPVMEKGIRLGPEAIGLLMSVGVVRIPVHSVPRIAVVVTGSEFTETEVLKEGHIFSSNDAMLMSALKQEGLDCTMLHAPDDADVMARVMREAITDHDLVITTGGVSVGDHDRVEETLLGLGAEIIFHNVAQKPGKPMLFARHGVKIVFGLPGNPRAVMILFWEYVLPYLRAMQGAAEPFLRCERLQLNGPVEVKGDRAEFRAAQIREGRVHLLRNEGSHMLASLVGADAIAYIPGTVRRMDETDVIEVHYLPMK